MKILSRLCLVVASGGTLLLANSLRADYVGSVLDLKDDVKAGTAIKGKKPVKEAGYSPYAGKR